MPEDFTWKIEGLDKLQKQLEELASPSTARKILRQGLRAGAKIALGAIVNNAPERTGFLRANFDIRIKLVKGDIAGFALIGPKGRMYYPGRGVAIRDERGRLRVATGKHAAKGGLVPVASVVRFLEFGTIHEGKHPFMTQAFDQQADAMVSAVRDALESVLAEVVKK